MWICLSSKNLGQLKCKQELNPFLTWKSPPSLLIGGTRWSPSPNIRDIGLPCNPDVTQLWMMLLTKMTDSDGNTTSKNEFWDMWPSTDVVTVRRRNRKTVTMSRMNALPTPWLMLDPMTDIMTDFMTIVVADDDILELVPAAKCYSEELFCLVSAVIIMVKHKNSETLQTPAVQV